MGDFLACGAMSTDQMVRRKLCASKMINYTDSEGSRGSYYSDNCQKHDDDNGMFPMIILKRKGTNNTIAMENKGKRRWMNIMKEKIKKT